MTSDRTADEDRELLEKMIAAVQANQDRPELPREFKLLVAEIERLRERVEELEYALSLVKDEEWDR